MSTPDVVVKVARLQKRAAIELDDGRTILVRKLNYEGFQLRERARLEDTPDAWYDLVVFCLPDLTAEEVRTLVAGEQIAAIVAIAVGQVDELLALLGKTEAEVPPSATPSGSA